MPQLRKNKGQNTFLCMVVNVTKMQSRRGAQVIVIHPGSRFLRIGKASDVSPATVLNVVARKCKSPVPRSTPVQRISRPRKDRHPTSNSEAEQNEDEHNVSLTSDDPVRSVLYTTISRVRGHKIL
jgi:actin-related protein 8